MKGGIYTDEKCFVCNGLLKDTGKRIVIQKATGRGTKVGGLV